MKSTLFILALFTFLAYSCSSTKQLSTGDGREINLSGTWNSTDASIVSRNISQKFQESVFYSNELLKQQSANVLNSVNINYAGLKEPFDKSLQEQVEKAFTQLAFIDSPSQSNQNDKLLKLTIDIQAQNIESFGEEAIQYSLFVNLYDLENTLVWKTSESIKKYLAD